MNSERVFAPHTSAHIRKRALGNVQFMSFFGGQRENSRTENIDRRLH